MEKQCKYCKKPYFDLEFGEFCSDYCEHQQGYEDYLVEEEIRKWEEEGYKASEEVISAEPVNEKLSITEFRKRILKLFIDEYFQIENLEAYKPAILQLMYTTLGLSLKNEVVFKIKKYILDFRSHFMVAAKSGNGKGLFKDPLLEILDELKLNGGVITSLHEEQLVGSDVKPIKEYFINRKKVTKSECEEASDNCEEIIYYLEKSKGFFDDDLIIKDDAVELFESSKFDTARSYFLNALDPYSKNPIRKEKVNQEYDLFYFPKAVVVTFIQDVPIPEKNLKTGLHRKLPIIYLKIPKKTKENYINSLIGEEVIKSGAYIKFLKELNKKEQLKFTKEVTDLIDDDKWKITRYSPITFSKDSLEYIGSYVDDLKSKLIEVNSKAENFMESYDWVAISNCLRFAAILKIAHLTELGEEFDSVEVDLETSKLACEDYKKVVYRVFSFYETFALTEKELFTKHEKLVIRLLTQFGANGKWIYKESILDEFKKLANVSGKTQFYTAIRTLEKKDVVKTGTKGKAVKGKPNAIIKLVRDVDFQ